MVIDDFFPLFPSHDLEALAVGCPSFVPHAFLKNDLLGARWTVERPIDIVDRIRTLRSLSVEQRQEIIDDQKDSLKSSGKFDVDYVIDFTESVM